MTMEKKSQAKTSRMIWPQTIDVHDKRCIQPSSFPGLIRGSMPNASSDRANIRKRPIFILKAWLEMSLRIKDTKKVK